MFKGAIKLKPIGSITKEIKFNIKNKSWILNPFLIDENDIGIITLIKEKKDYFKIDDFQFYEGLSNILGIAIANHRAKHALSERVKELTCLYSVSKIAENENQSFSELMQNIVNVLPPAWQYPKITSAVISIDDMNFYTKDFKEGVSEQKADIIIDGLKRGFIKVSYSEEKTKSDEGPFLKEERNLIDALARQIALIIERKQVDEEKEKLQEQLRHADRLATIGQLAAGVAHELNEPLANI